MKTTETPMNLFWLDAGAQLLAARSPHPGSARRNGRLQWTVAGSTLHPGTRVPRAVGCVRLHAYTFPAEQVWLCGYAAACLTGTKLNEDFSGGRRRPLCITRVWKRKRFYRWLASEGPRPGTDPSSSAVPPDVRHEQRKPSCWSIPEACPTAFWNTGQWKGTLSESRCHCRGLDGDMLQRLLGKQKKSTSSTTMSV